MKILYINDYGTPTGGAETVILALRDGMRARGHEAMFFASTARPGDVQSEADEHCYGTLSRWRTVVQALNISAYANLNRVLQSFQPDIVHVKLFLTQLSPLILPLLRDVPSLYHAVWYREACPTGTKTLPDLSECRHRVGAVCATGGCIPPWDWPIVMGQMKLWRHWAGMFDEIVPVSAAVKNVLAHEGIESNEVIPNGVVVRPMRAGLSDQSTAVFAGRLVKEKGADVLIDAMAMVLKEIPGAQLLIAGDGTERAALEKRAADLGISANVEFLGHLSRNAVESRFESAWVQVVCSRWAEPFGMVAVEAMMRGTAVIASEGGGLGEIVEHDKTGLVVPRGNVPVLADAMKRLLRDRPLVESMGVAGHRLAVEKYSMNLFLDRFEAIYQRMIANGKKSAHAK